MIKAKKNYGKLDDSVVSVCNYSDNNTNRQVVGGGCSNYRHGMTAIYCIYIQTDENKKNKNVLQNQ